MRRSPITSGFAVLVLVVAAQGCASPGMPVAQTIRVLTPGCAQASCELSNDRGRWLLPQAPGSVTVTTSHEPLKVSCRADDAAPTSAKASSSRTGTTGAGAVTGGAVGGAAVGAAFGATALAFIPPLGIIAVLTGVGAGAAAGNAVEANKQPLHYPGLIAIPMTCAAADGTPAEPAAKAPVLGLSIRGLTLAEARSAGLGERGAVLVTAVAPDGLAAAAGLRSGDILIAMDGENLGDAADLEERVLALAAEAPLALRVWRNGQTIDMVLTRVSKGAR